jgi:hypothetical protein
MRAGEFRGLLILLARLNPAIWDAVNPIGPVAVSAADLNPQPLPPKKPPAVFEADLNPQPLPPREPDLQSAVRRTAVAVADAAVAVQLASGDADRVLVEVGDDWCPTPPHPKIPWPRHWPHPWPPGEPYPIDPELITPAVQIEAALVFQAYAADAADGSLSEGFAALADRLLEAAVSG